MTLEEMLEQLQPGQDLELKFTPHTATILRASRLVCVVEGKQRYAS